MAIEYWTKDSTWLMKSLCSTDAALAKLSAYSFSSLRTYTNLVKSPSFIFLLTMFRYSFIRYPFAS